MQSKIDITRYDGIYQCPKSKCRFVASDGEFLVVANYWDAASDASDRKPLNGFGSDTYGEYSDECRRIIVKAITEEYSENVAKTGKTLLSIPTLVMRFKVS